MNMRAGLGRRMDTGIPFGNYPDAMMKGPAEGAPALHKSSASIFPNHRLFCAEADPYIPTRHQKQKQKRRNEDGQYRNTKI